MNSSTNTKWSFFCYEVKLNSFLDIFCSLQIMEKLVDIVIYIHQAITEAFGNNGMNFQGISNLMKLLNMSFTYAPLLNLSTYKFSLQYLVPFQSSDLKFHGTWSCFPSFITVTSWGYWKMRGFGELIICQLHVITCATSTAWNWNFRRKRKFCLGMKLESVKSQTWQILFATNCVFFLCKIFVMHLQWNKTFSCSLCLQCLMVNIA